MVNSRISPVQLGASVRKFNLNRPFICPILFLFRAPCCGQYFLDWGGKIRRQLPTYHGYHRQKTEHGGSVRLYIITTPKSYCIPRLYYNEEHTNKQPHDGINAANLRFRIDSKTTYVFENLEIRRKQRGDQKTRKYFDWVLAPHGGDTGLAVIKEMMAGRKVYAQMSHDGSWDSKNFSWDLTGFKRNLEDQIDVCRRESSKIGREAEPDDPWS